ncbi:hypothetical protein BZZ01_15565 [Nostocales cyanobacterium HT-58-2]|nr:hypothetical protein BZZ01_15565 [Nostocales cyanobacterium HT-58-2]
MHCLAITMHFPAIIMHRFAIMMYFSTITMHCLAITIHASYIRYSQFPIPNHVMILVTRRAGYICSYAVLALKNAGYELIVLAICIDITYAEMSEK